MGDRVIVYHISGCGVCNDCRRGYMISCTSEQYRRAYGWQRDGGMADYLLAEEKDLIHLPDELSYADGAQVACGFGTVYEGLQKIGISGERRGADHGAGAGGAGDGGAVPQARGASGSSASTWCRSACSWRASWDCATKCCASGPDNVARGARADRRPRRGARGGLLGQRRGARDGDPRDAQMGTDRVPGRRRAVEFNPSPDIIHDQKTIYGSWVTSTWLMEELVERLVRWNLHPADLVTHRFALDEVSQRTR